MAAEMDLMGRLTFIFFFLIKGRLIYFSPSLLSLIFNVNMELHLFVTVCQVQCVGMILILFSNSIVVMINFTWGLAITVRENSCLSCKSSWAQL